MEIKFNNKLLTTLLIGAAVVMVPKVALAVGTTACTSIANTALLDYNVGSVAQTQIPGVATPFVIGNKINLEVVTSNASPGVSVAQGAIDPTTTFLTFTVTNTGNKVQDYALSVINLAASQTAWSGTIDDEFDAGAGIAYVENGSNSGYQAAEDSLFIDELDPDATATVFVEIAGPVPAAAGDADNALYGLKAQTHRGGLSGSQGALVVDGETGACSEDTVFADLAAGTGLDDGDLDGADSERSGLVVSASATLTVGKTSAVYSDPINGVGAGAVAIPGAVITYSILITNPGASTATATSISISDSLDTQITAGNVAFKTLYDDGTTTCAAGQGIVIDTTCKTNLSAGDDNVDWGVTVGNTVTVTGLSLAPGVSTTVKFQVTIL